MDKNDDNRQQLIAEMLALHEHDSAPDRLRHELMLWERLAARLAPLIGESGFHALYGRAVRLVRPQYSWLETDSSQQTIRLLLNGLERKLTLVDPQLARQANATFLHSFTSLLASLIGEALTMRVLHAAWQDESEDKNTQEQK
jgi:hypothetical protein